MNSLTRVTFLLYIPFLFFPYLVDNYSGVSYYNHALFLVFFFILTAVSKEGIRFLLSPSSITCLYLYVCFFLGDLLFRSEANIKVHHTIYYLQWRHYQLASTYTNICVYLSLVTYFFTNTPRHFFFKRNNVKTTKITIVILALLFVFSAPFASLDIPGGLNKMIFSLASIGLICYLAFKNSSSRFILYLAILAIMAIANPDDKRNSIFLVYIILLVESRNLSKLTFSRILIGIVAGVSLFVLIIIMSIFRTGAVNSLSEVVSYMPIYLNSDVALGTIANNFEIDYTFINSFTPIEFIERDLGLLNYGMSYLKVFFIPFSRGIMPDKPDATMVLYTKVYDGADAAAGMCYPINLAAEAYWNFRYFGIFITPLIYYYLNLYYCHGFNLYTKDHSTNSFSAIFYFYVMYLITFLIRGSGFDIFVSSMIMVWCLILILRFISLKINFKIH